MGEGLVCSVSVDQLLTLGTMKKMVSMQRVLGTSKRLISINLPVYNAANDHTR